MLADLDINKVNKMMFWQPSMEGSSGGQGAKSESENKLFVILRSSDEKLEDAAIVKVLKSKIRPEAEQEAIKWLLGDGLPCSGSPSDVYSIAEVSVNAQVNAKLLWTINYFKKTE